jgi:hypothetical protein
VLIRYRTCVDTGGRAASATQRMTQCSIQRVSAASTLSFVGNKHQSCLPVLYLAETAIAGQSLGRLSALRQLESLVVDHTQIVDSGMASLSGLTKLRRLVLNHTHVGDSGLQHLAGLPKLQEIDVFRTNVTAQGVAQLQKAIPQARISH